MAIKKTFYTKSGKTTRNMTAKEISDDPLSKLKNDYAAATTIEQRLTICEKMLGLK